MRKYSAGSLVLISTLMNHVGCIKAKKTESQIASGNSSATTACVGLQGNGLRFSSHVGTYVALLENNIRPVVTLGGSSGSIVGSVVMALMQNQSVKKSAVNFQGRNLSETQRAALVLAAIPDVLDTFIFLPAFNSLDIRNWQVVPSILRFIVQSQFGKVLAGDDGARLLSIEATVGQAVLLADFTQNADFSSVLAADKYTDRRKKMFELWQKWSDGMTTTIKELVDAAALPESQWESKPQMAAIGDRFYRMFQQDMKQENSEANVERWRLLLRGVNSLVKNGNLPAMLGSDKLDEFMAAKFFLPNPALLWRAYLGYGKNGQFVQLPHGMIVHSTLRRGIFLRSKDGSITASEGVGAENLFQGYIASNHPGSPIFEELVALRAKQAELGGGFQPYFPSGGAEPGSLSFAYPASRVALLRNSPEAAGRVIGDTKDDSQSDVMFKEGRRGMAHAVAYSAGEPGPFRRLPVFVSSQDVRDNALKTTSGQTIHILSNISDPDRLGEQDGLISFGGWSENVPVSTLAMLPSCSTAGVFVSSGKKGPGNDFQLEAIRASIRGWNFVTTTIENIGSALKGSKPETEQQVRSHFDALNRNVEFSRQMTARSLGYNAASGRWETGKSLARSYFQQDIDFDIPSELSLEKKTLNGINARIINSRFALMVTSYQKASENMDLAGPTLQGLRQSRINAFGDGHSGVSANDLSAKAAALYRKSSIEEINQVLNTFR